MSQDALTLYKLIILYMLNRVNFPLTKAQIGEFVLEKEYTNFLTLQQATNELIEVHMITAESIRNRTHLSITSEGKDTLSYFEDRISPSIRSDIDEFFNSHEMEMKNEVSIIADYYKATNGEYEAHMIAKDNGIKLIDLTLSVPDEDTANHICSNWQKNNQNIYKYLIEQLF